MSMELKVVKVGGAHLQSETFLDELMCYIQSLVQSNGHVVLVHGGGKEIEDLHASTGHAFEKSAGLRVTSEESMDLVTMVLSGLVNKRLVASCINHGMEAFGVSGVDSSLMQAKFLNRRQLGRVGGPPVIRTEKMIDLIETTDVLVVSPICRGPDGNPVNVNADSAAQSIAIALQVDCLDFVTDVDSVRTQQGNVRHLSMSEIDSLIESSVISGGMIPKLQASLAALDGGVPRVRVGSLNSLKAGDATEVLR